MQSSLFPEPEKDAFHELCKAEQKAGQLFEEIEHRGLMVAGKSEKTLNKEIYDLAKEMFGVTKHWHKRIVRAGKNTLEPYRENPPDLILQEDDIVFFDFGPVFEEWEADFGRTYVLGNNPDKLRLKADVETVWNHCRDWFFAQPQPVIPADLYAKAVKTANEYGWSFGAHIAGHIVGHFPHEKLDPDQRDHYIQGSNHKPMSDPDRGGKKRHWILEIHLVDREKEVGAFFEQLLRI